ncbi:MAG: type II secretion system F family protein [Lachnospiraceae bacterium]|nr:type II secretion system F family protein [Lachnospiraceae bacterium]
MRGKERAKRFTAEETASFCEQIAMLLNSGIPLYEGAYILAEEVEDKRTSEILSRIEELVRDNHYLYEALQETGAFPDYMVHMVKVGEMTGKLEEVLRSLAVFYEREANVTAAIKSAITFPVILFAMMSVIMLVVVGKIIPMFEEMFLELNVQVAEATGEMLNTGVMTGKIFAWVTCVLFVLLIVLLVLYGMGVSWVKKLVFVFRTSRRVSELMATGQFVSSLALMTVSGMDQMETFEMAIDGCKNAKVQAKIIRCKELLEQGEGLDEALGHSGLLSGREYRMVGVAMRSGASDEVFAKLGKQYDEKCGAVLSSLSGKIETGMVVVLAVMVGTVLISIMLPLVSMISAIG